MPDPPYTPVTRPPNIFDPATDIPASPTNPLPVPTTLPTAPPGAAPGPTPASGQGSAAELRKERDRVSAQLDKVQAQIERMTADDPDVPVPPEVTNQVTALNNRIATLTEQITQAEARGPSVISGGSPQDKYIIRAAPDGTIMTDPSTGQPPLNPNWDGKTDKPQVANVGTHIVTVGTDGNVTVAYTDTDAQALASRQTAVAETQARVAAAAQETTAAASRATTELAERVSRGEDAASVRAQQAQDLAALHQKWVEADGDARRAQEQLRDYQTERHQTAADTLGRDQLTATATAQQMQDATTRRGQDVGQAQAVANNLTTQRGQDINERTTLRGQDIGARTQAADRSAQTRTSLANQRLSTGAQYMSNVLGMMAQLNRDAPPGSSAVGNMLGPLLDVGKQYFGSLGGLDSADAILAASGGVPLNTGGATAAAQPPDLSKPLTTPDTTPTALAAAAPDLNRGVVTPSVSGDPTVDAWFDAMMQRRRDMAQRGIDAGYDNSIPGFAAGGVVTQPTLAMVGEQGPEAIVPLGAGGGPPPPMPADNSTGVLSIVGDFLSKLGGAVGSGAPPTPATPGPLPPLQALAGQAASMMGAPPAAGANPMLPGSAVPGLPPQAAAAQALANPIGPDGSPYAKPGDVAARLQARRQGRPGLTPPPSAPPSAAMPSTAGAGV
jgi:hypothetical protein